MIFLVENFDFFSAKVFFLVYVLILFIYNYTKNKSIINNIFYIFINKFILRMRIMVLFKKYGKTLKSTLR